MREFIDLKYHFAWQTTGKLKVLTGDIRTTLDDRLRRVYTNPNPC